MNSEKLYPKIKERLQTLSPTKISKERRVVLNPLIEYLKIKLNNKKSIALNFICTHNSRRSHLAQVWAQTIATYLGISNIHCYSGGTEATAVFPMVVETLRNQGFHIEQRSQDNNPIYTIKYSQNSHPIIGFSKTFDDSYNPKTNFAAIMTCSSADKDCPFVEGSDGRFPIPYQDPKAFDNTPRQAEKYQERSLQIATELLYVFSNVME